MQHNERYTVIMCRSLENRELKSKKLWHFSCNLGEAASS